MRSTSSCLREKRCEWSSDRRVSKGTKVLRSAMLEPYWVGVDWVSEEVGGGARRPPEIVDPPLLFHHRLKSKVATADYYILIRCDCYCFGVLKTIRASWFSWMKRNGVQEDRDYD
ncbi:hypothetical protein LOK49_LG08G01311 [Camellia lanceoleosa]|uniref:Uncharacterized protein n=1 Tax=Camellia lanceoleosa TaxID=1840588 RepID=A0ACC0GTX6_9ERIC|nr:hypothetical protein LOK49_LG08G01311 [Camellia lanceoleosa]